MQRDGVGLARAVLGWVGIFALDVRKYRRTFRMG